MIDPENFDIDLSLPFDVEDSPLSNIEFVGDDGLATLESLRILIKTLEEEGIYPPLPIFSNSSQVVAFFAEATGRDELEMDMFLRNRGLLNLQAFIPLDPEELR